MSGSSIVTQGFMMKRKGTNGCLSLKWDTLFFVLHKDGRLVYHKDAKSSVSDVGGGRVICTNVAECNIDRIAASEVSVANSFFVTVRSSGATTLLVTNGPEAYKQWILSFRKLKASVSLGVNVGGSMPVKAAAARSAAAVGGTANSMRAKDAEQRPAASVGGNATATANSMPAKVAEQRQVEANAAAAATATAVAANEQFKKEKEAEKARLEKERLAAAEQAERERLERERLEEERRLAAEKAEGERQAELERLEKERIAEEERLEAAEQLRKKAEEDAALEQEVKELMKDYKENTGEDVVLVPAGEEAKIPEQPVESFEELSEILNDLHKKETEKGDKEETPATDGEEKDKEDEEAEEVDKRTCYEKALANQEVLVDMIDEFGKMTEAEIAMAATVFACGNTFDELEKSLDSKKVLFGIFVTSFGEMMLTTSSGTTNPTPEENALISFSLQYEGGDAHYTEVNKFNNHLHLIGSFCKKHVIFDMIHPIVYSKGDARSQILKRLGAPGSNEEEDNKGDDAKGNINLEGKDISIYSDTGKTAYKRALEDDPANVPSGEEILKQLREPLGFPYNWVLFDPSKSNLIIKDAGSGGVMELTKILQGETYDKCVLFGLVRLSFAAEDFGRRQFWCGINWKGENCSGVKVMRQVRECSNPMTKMIGDRSFTLSNVSASEMTLEMFVDSVTHNCNVTDFKVTVETMKNAHVEEQKAIKDYWKKLEEGRNAEVAKKRKEEEEQLRLRQEKLESVRKSHKLRRSKMTVTELLEDLGNDDVPGWVLLEF